MSDASERGSTVHQDHLSPALRARGRRLAIASHPAGMTHRMAYTDHLPTLVLVALGASDMVVGLQRAFEPLGQLLQLATLRLVGRFRKRSILIAGQVVGLVGGLPLLAFGALAAAPPPWGLAIALVAFASVAAGIVITQTVWFPLLRGYVERHRVGQFFGLLRTGWHLVLIVYFVGAQRWLAAAPGAFAPLFAVATLCGLLRIALVARLPEAPSELGQRIRMREALALLGSEPRLRLYLAGVGLAGAARQVVVPFAIVMMRRVLGLSDGDVMLATVAFFAGGFVSLYLWGRAVDRLAAWPVFLITAVGLACVYAALQAVDVATAGAVHMALIFFVLAVLNAGFGVADTNVRFALAPRQAPTRLLVVADVASNLAYGLAPFLAGAALDAAFALGVVPMVAYRVLFAGAAAATLLALLPLARLRPAG